jgi:uncharacterized protein (DUF2235 family)
VPKNIVICSDGTGNSDTGVPSNVKRLYDLIVQQGPRQVGTYDKGVGTEHRRPCESWVRYRYEHARSLCFGDGVAENLLQLYTWLVSQYEPGDRVFLFGFSRGAFTVRALAGLVHVCGLLRPGNIGRAPDAVRLYEGSEERIKQARRRDGLDPTFDPNDTDHGAMDQVARDFKSRHGQPCAVHFFLGLWDTVKAYGWISPKSFPALRHNPSVRAVRHAPALDERRALFKMTGWGDRHPDVKEVWFAGDHSDVGGGHKDGNSPLADASLRWMLGEATQQGLQLDPDMASDVRQIAQRSVEAPRTAPKDLWLRRGFIALDCAPRVELDNTYYPPSRHYRVLWTDGARKPGDHKFGNTVSVHHTVDARLRADANTNADDARYARNRLTRCSKASEPASAIELQVAPDLEILWHTQ